MFIRKRIKILKSGNSRTSYQVLRNYRDGGKIRQEVMVKLLCYPTLEEAINYAKQKCSWFESSDGRIERMEKMRCPKMMKYKFWKEWLDKLIVVSEMSRQRDKLDTTDVVVNISAQEEKTDTTERNNS